MIAARVYWWIDRSNREKWLLAILAGLLLVLAAWFGLVRPLVEARAAAAERYGLAIAALGEIEAVAQKIRRAEGHTGPPPSLPLDELVAQRAGEAGLTTERPATRSDGSITMRIDAVRPVPLLRWLAVMKERDGVTVDAINATSNDDATIMVELGLRNGRRR